jgi:hypothetical protein
MMRTSRCRPQARRFPGWWSLLLLAGGALLLPSCSTIEFLGYSSASQFPDYKTIRVPIFQNRTYYRGLEQQLNQLIVTQIERMSPYKVVDGDADLELDGRILSYIKSTVLESPVNEQRVVDTVMTVEVVLKDLRTGEILSKPPRRPGGPLALETIPQPNESPDVPPGGPVPPSATPPPMGFIPLPSLPTVPGAPDQAAVMNDGPPLPDGQGPGLPLPPPPPGVRPFGPGIVIRSTGTYIPELGQSITTAEQRVCYNIAVQIVNMMEKAW